jgi:hypothetical protein
MTRDHFNLLQPGDIVRAPGGVERKVISRYRDALMVERIAVNWNHDRRLIPQLTDGVRVTFSQMAGHEVVSCAGMVEVGVG